MAEASHIQYNTVNHSTCICVYVLIYVWEALLIHLFIPKSCGSEHFDVSHCND